MSAREARWVRLAVCFVMLVVLARVAPAEAAPCLPEPAPDQTIGLQAASESWCIAGKVATGETDTLRWSLPAGAAGLWHLELEGLPGQGGALALSRYSADGYHQVLWKGTLYPHAGRLAPATLLLAQGDYVLNVVPGDGSLVYRLRLTPEGNLPAPLTPEAALGADGGLLVGTGTDLGIPWHVEPAAPGTLWTVALQVPPDARPYVQLTDAAGNTLLRSTQGDANGVLRLPDLALPAGDYHLQVIGLAAGIPAVLSLRADQRPPSFAAEPDEAPGQAHVLAIGSSATGGLSTNGIYDDADYFVLDLPPGGDRAIDATLNGPPGARFTLAIADAAGNVLMQRQGQGEVRLRELALAPGRHWLRVAGTLAPQQSYRLAVEDLGPPTAGVEREPNDVAATATAVPAAQALVGSFAGDDSDYIDLGVGGGLQLWTVETSGEGLSRMMLYDNLGNAIAVANAAADTAVLRLSRIVLPPGRNLLRLDGRDGRWLLRTLQLGPPVAGEEVEPNDDEPHALPLALGQPQTGWLDRIGDRDVYAFHLEAEQRLALALDAPADAPVQATLGWGATGSPLVAGSTAMLDGRQALAWDLLLPPGDFLLDLAPYGYGGNIAGLYRLVLRPVPFFDRPADLEPNDASWQARPLPASGRLAGMVSPDSADWYRLPDGDSASTLAVTALMVPERGVGIRLASALENGTTESLATLWLYAAGERGDLVLPPGEVAPGRLLQVEGGPGRYALSLDTVPADSATPLPLSASLSFEPPAAAAFEPLGQALKGLLHLANDGTAALRLVPSAHAGDERWVLEGLPAAVELAAGETRDIPFRLLIAPESRDDAPVSVDVALRTAGGTAVSAGTTVTLVPGLPAIAPFRAWPLPTELLGGSNVAAAARGASIDAAAGLIDGIVDATGVTLGGAAPPVVDLAGDVPVSLVGVILQAPAAALPAERLADFAIEVSTDGTTFRRVLQARLSPLSREQGFAFEAPVEARLVRLVPLSRHGAPAADRAQLAEFKVIAVPAPVADLGEDIAAVALGGHVVRSLGFGQRSLTGESALWPGDGTLAVEAAGAPAWVLAFHNGRAAEIAELVWRERADAPPEQRIAAVEIAASLVGPLGPWKPLGRWPLDGETSTFRLPAPLWARALAFRVVEPATGQVTLPERIAVYEAAGGLSILGEWGEASSAGPYEASLQALPAPPDLPPVGHEAAAATALPLGTEALGQVRRGLSEDWYAIELPQETRQLRADFGGDAAPEVMLTLVDAAGAEATLLPVPDMPGVLMAPAAPGAWLLRVTQPPQSVAVAWDTSSSVGALYSAIVRAVKQFSWGLDPGREEVNLIPFRGEATVPLLEGWSGDPAVVYAALHAYPWTDSSSDAESAVIAGAEALSQRVGARALALITDASYANVYRNEPLWQALQSAGVRVFALYLPVDADVRRAQAQIHLMQDWAGANGGFFARMATRDDGEAAFRRIIAWLERPADYAFVLAADTTPPPPGQLSVVRAPAADAASGAAAATLAVEIVLDASGSMLADLGGKARIDVAKQGLSELGAATLPEGVTVGLRVFGHRGGTSCASELVLPLAPLDRAAYAKAVESIRVKSKSKTALAESIRLAGADLAALGGQRILVLVTDGLETCGGDPQAEIAALRGQGLDVRLNIVGFALDDPAVRETFAQWAAAGGGSYFDAADPAALAAAISEAASGVPFVVLDKAGDEVAQGLVGGPPIELPAGRYRLLVGETDYAVEIRSGELVSVTVDEPR